MEKDARKGGYEMVSLSEVVDRKEFIARAEACFEQDPAQAMTDLAGQGPPERPRSSQRLQDLDGRGPPARPLQTPMGLEPLDPLPRLGLYLLLLRVSLPAIDLLLDIGNYHLASEKDRRTYYRPIEDAVSALERIGWKEIQILAHSLGTVITYDWLRSAGKRYPIVALHTIGSPLNKFWYLDNSRLRRLADTVAFVNFPALLGRIIGLTPT